MAANVNIPRDVKDPFYRYRMPLLQSKVEGKGNGIKTVLPNIVDVAKALSRPPGYPTKYFGNELGAQTKVEGADEKFIVNGAHDSEKLQTLLDGFIERFVLCGSCRNPETDLSITKDQMIVRKCGACGALSDVDMRHRLATYILKNPPPKSKKAGKHAGTANGDDAANGDMDALAHGAAGLAFSDDDDDGWDCDEEALSKARSGGGPLAQGAAGDDEDDAGAEEADPFDQLGDFIGQGEPDDDAIFARARELGLQANHRAVVVVIQCVFEGSTTLVKDIGKHKKLLTRFGRGEKHQRAIVGGFERLISASPDALLSKTPAILKALFDRDIVEEDVLLDWGKKPSKKYVDKDVAKRIHKAAQPFIEWLETAEEESDSDGE
ncbi:eukaryotic translation initiation factor 5 [Coemansia nantahalensis]|uniref:Eukaryotic translation initiation factor 5 n=1 Tax=Coemansia nantahalensis TaxID=2789366 RepID=A0ACC1JT33_9FUNG|nr:eukaryotic translation initiation factor 5 [Coemansia nantahalensis]